jgi:hypothetical protein
MSRNVRDSDISKAQLRRLLKEWENGRPKSRIEKEELNDPDSNGKRMSRLWREELGVETEGVHPMTRKIERLRQQVIDLGGDPDEEE